jgi:hypothetical protein
MNCQDVCFILLISSISLSVIGGISVGLGYGIAKISYPYPKYRCSTERHEFTLLCFSEGFIAFLGLFITCVLLVLLGIGIFNIIQYFYRKKLSYQSVN